MLTAQYDSPSMEVGIKHDGQMGRQTGRRATAIAVVWYERRRAGNKTTSHVTQPYFHTIQYIAIACYCY